METRRGELFEIEEVDATRGYLHNGLTVTMGWFISALDQISSMKGRG
jgi:hypothetical protein